MALTIKYQTIVEKVAVATKTTINRSHTIIKGLSDVLKEAIDKGEDIDCFGIFTIKYTTRTNEEIYRNNMVDFKQQIDRISVLTGIDKEEVELVLNTYYKQVKMYLESGFQVNIKSIGYVEPQEKDGVVKYFSRIAPGLQNHKAKYVDFLILNSDGEVLIKEFRQHQLRFNMEINQTLETPIAVKQNNITILKGE